MYSRGNYQYDIGSVYTGILSKYVFFKFSERASNTLYTKRAYVLKMWTINIDRM